MSQTRSKLVQGRRGLRCGIWDLSGAMGSETPSQTGVCSGETGVVRSGGCDVKTKRLTESHWAARSDLDSGRTNVTNTRKQPKANAGAVGDGARTGMVVTSGTLELG